MQGWGRGVALACARIMRPHPHTRPRARDPTGGLVFDSSRIPPHDPPDGGSVGGPERASVVCMPRKLRTIARSVSDALERGVKPVAPKVVAKPSPGRLAKRAARELEKPGCEPVSFKLSTLRELLLLELERDEGHNAKAVARALVARAMEGDPYCIRLLMERVDGLLPRNVSVNGQIAVGQVVTLVDTRSMGVELPAFVHASVKASSALTGGGSASPSVLSHLTPSVEEIHLLSDSNSQLSSNSTAATNLEAESFLETSLLQETPLLTEKQLD